MTHRFKIKVCGITRPSDAQLIGDLGADLAGLVFYRKSPRFVTAQSARNVVAALSPLVSPVGVFVNEPLADILRRANDLGLRFVQLHGLYQVRDLRTLTAAGLQVIQAFGIGSQSDLNDAVRSTADLVLLDASAPGLHGGTGSRFDWSLSVPRRPRNIVLSGGLDASNVAEGVKRFRPAVVDVNSGVESRPGIKSKKKLIEFVSVCDRIRYGS